jgi:hypothetical protein
VCELLIVREEVTILLRRDREERRLVPLAYIGGCTTRLGKIDARSIDGRLVHELLVVGEEMTVLCRGDREEGGLVPFADDWCLPISELFSYRGEGAGRRGSMKGPMGG